MSSMHIDRITFYRGREFGEGGVVWADHSSELPLPVPDGRGDLGTFLINVGVDGAFTIVNHQGGNRAVLARVIEDLTFLLERLDDTYPSDEPRGRCLIPAEGHDEDHTFPTEEDWQRSRGLPGSLADNLRSATPGPTQRVVA